MNHKELIDAIKIHSPELPPVTVLDQLKHLYNEKAEWGQRDSNSSTRSDVVISLYEEANDKLLNVFRYLMQQEILYCRQESLMTIALKQLCYILYRIGHIEDIALLYEAKFDTCFDARHILDLELIYGKNKNHVKDFYTTHPCKYDIVTTIIQNEEAICLSHEEYMEHILMYDPNDE